MSPEHHFSHSEVKITRELLSKLLSDTNFDKRIKNGIKVVKAHNRETGFTAFSNGIDILVSKPVHSRTTLIGSIDEYMEGKPVIIKQSLKINQAKSGNTTGMDQIGIFHFHPNGNTTPSSQDADAYVSSVYGFKQDKTFRVNRRLISGIFAVKDPSLQDTPRGHLSYLFFGLGNDGLSSNIYQSIDTLHQESGFKNAMEQSGFWIVEGTAYVSGKEPIHWGENIIDRLEEKLAN